jgi:energy-coupling factor transporter ATP-binding protein EcfA2
MLASSMCWRWLRLRLQSLANCASALVAVWICLHPHQMDAGMTALMFTFSGQVTGYLQYLINTFTNLEIQMNCIERVKHYTEVATEAAFDEKDPRGGPDGQPLAIPDRSWPSCGKIEFDWCCARYRPGLPLVIEDVAFTVNAEEKVGVVGRTGSGKSTLMQLLFRIIELHSGSVKFDGVDIAKVGLRQLRTAIAILPQGVSPDSTRVRQLYTLKALRVAPDQTRPSSPAPFAITSTHSRSTPTNSCGRPWAGPRCPRRCKTCRKSWTRRWAKAGSPFPSGSASCSASPARCSPNARSSSWTSAPPPSMSRSALHLVHGRRALIAALSDLRVSLVCFLLQTDAKIQVRPAMASALSRGGTLS